MQNNQYNVNRQGANYAHQGARRMPNSVFTGGLAGLIGHEILAGLLTALTLGIAYPWAVVYLLRWKASHTYIDGRRLTFTGTAMGLFGNWILWGLLTVVTCGIYGFWVRINMIKWEVSHTHFARR